MTPDPGAVNSAIVSWRRRLQHPCRRPPFQQPGSMARPIKEHGAIIEAIERKDDAAAQHSCVRTSIC